MPKFFINSRNIDGSLIVLEKDDVAHITNVLRMGPGDQLTVCDGQSSDYLCELCETGGGRAVARIISKSPALGEPTLRAVLFQCLPKGDKMDYIVQKAVELGASSIVPVASSRCVVRLDGPSGAKKAARWQKIAEEAAKQCGRGIIPTVLAPVSFSYALEMMGKTKHRILFYEKEQNTHIHHLLDSEMTELALFVGPEGGFTDEEAALAIESGIRASSLGSRILRTETAGVCALSAAMFLTRNL